VETKLDYYYYFKKTHPTLEIAPSSPPYPKKNSPFQKRKKHQVLSPLPKAPFITYGLIFSAYFYYSPSISI
jgi:hypothetical protein